MAKPERIVYICDNRRPEGHPRGSCAQKDSGEVLMKFAELIDSEGLLGKVTLAQTSCIGPCFEGPIVNIQPDNIWYKQVTENDVQTVIREHLIGGEPVDRLIFKDDEWD